MSVLGSGAFGDDGFPLDKRLSPKTPHPGVCALTFAGVSGWYFGPPLGVDMLGGLLAAMDAKRDADPFVSVAG